MRIWVCSVAPAKFNISNPDIVAKATVEIERSRRPAAMSMMTVEQRGRGALSPQPNNSGLRCPHCAPARDTRQYRGTVNDCGGDVMRHAGDGRRNVTGIN
jgi:hypothetical protein